MFFIAFEIITHPETLEPIIELHKGYSIKAIEEICKETGIDYCDGQIITLEYARHLRATNVITGFIIHKSEESN